MNRIYRYLPGSAMKIYASPVISHLPLGLTCFSVEWERILRLQKRALRIMMNSKYNAHTDPLFKDLLMLKVKDIFDVQCLKLWYKSVNNEFPHFFKSILTYDHELYETETYSHGMLHLYPTRTAVTRNVVRRCISELLLEFPAHLRGKCSLAVWVLLLLISSLIWLAHIPMRALRWTEIYQLNS